MDTESYSPSVNGTDYFISARHMAWYWDQYRGDAGGLDEDPYFSPSIASDLAGLPPAIIITAEFDALRDEGIEYHERLLASGVPSERIHYAGQIHGFMTLLDAIGEAHDAVADLGSRIGAAFTAITPTGS